MESVHNWIDKNTYHYSAFNDLAELVKLKKKRGVKISLCFPTLNEEKTIGKSIVIMKSELMDRFPLVDEIAVIDSGSTDRTLDIAEKFGATTYVASEHLKEHGDFKGKGENLWKAIHLLKGDTVLLEDGTDLAETGQTPIPCLLGKKKGPAFGKP